MAPICGASGGGSGLVRRPHSFPSVHSLNSYIEIPLGKISAREVVTELRRLLDTSAVTVAKKVLDNLLADDAIDWPLIDEDAWIVHCKPILLMPEMRVREKKQALPNVEPQKGEPQSLKPQYLEPQLQQPSAQRQEESSIREEAAAAAKRYFVSQQHPAQPRNQESAAEDCPSAEWKRRSSGNSGFKLFADQRPVLDGGADEAGFPPGPADRRPGRRPTAVRQLLHKAWKGSSGVWDRRVTPMPLGPEVQREAAAAGASAASGRDATPMGTPVCATQMRSVVPQTQSAESWCPGL
eukprot:TRINITY_DN18587_c0_g1_i1.p1 TRINITY_DN18587_c0_g1~~TRINITY_DN18587_c0_g1_i1.p1  ORF type:complete len:295 (-),score=61.46 TRINITY_DN18587_c0_g1_i1:787-1671(-)